MRYDQHPTRRQKWGKQDKTKQNNRFSFDFHLKAHNRCNVPLAIVRKKCSLRCAAERDYTADNDYGPIKGYYCQNFHDLSLIKVRQINTAP